MNTFYCVNGQHMALLLSQHLLYVLLLLLIPAIKQPMHNSVSASIAQGFHSSARQPLATARQNHFSALDRRTQFDLPSSEDSSRLPSSVYSLTYSRNMDDSAALDDLWLKHSVNEAAQRRNSLAQEPAGHNFLLSAASGGSAPEQFLQRFNTMPFGDSMVSDDDEQSLRGNDEAQRQFMGITQQQQQQQITDELKQKMEADFEAQLKKALQARELSSLKNELEHSTDVDKQQQQQPQRTNQQNHRLEEDEFDFEHDDTNSNVQDDGLGAVGDLETMADERAAARVGLLRAGQIRGDQSRNQAGSIMIPSLLKQGTTTPTRRGGGSLVVASPKNNDNNSKHQVPLQKRAVASRLCGNKLVEAIIRVCNGCVKPAGGKPVSAKRSIVNVVKRSSLTEKCCINRCTITDLKSFCCD